MQLVSHLNAPSIAARNRSSAQADARERLLYAVAEASVLYGYAHLTVDRLLAAAGVSRASFYQYFTSVDDCFWAAYRRYAEELVDDVSVAARRNHPRHIGLLDALVTFARSRPQQALMLMREGLAAGPAGFSERDRLISNIVDVGGLGSVPSAIDLPATTLIGGILRFLCIRLSDGGGMERVPKELSQWARAFSSEDSPTGWSAKFVPPKPRDEHRSALRLHRPAAHCAPRDRILRATAAAIREEGYGAVTVADIVRLAGVSRRTFYNEFASKADVFVAAYEHAFGEAIAACTPAFFSAGTWPERVWTGAHAFTSFFSREPLFAHLGFVECYAVGPSFVSRVHDTQLAFTLFLEEGYRQGSRPDSLSRACSTLVASTTFEAAFQASRICPAMQLKSLQPLAVYVTLAPYIGVDAAGGFVASKLGAKAPARA